MNLANMNNPALMSPIQIESRVDTSLSAIDAITRLVIHGSLLAQSDSWRDGLMGHVRPYTKKIEDHVFFDILSSLFALSNDLAGSDAVDSRIVSGMNGILLVARRILLGRDSPIIKKRILDDNEIERLNLWFDVVGDTYHRLTSFKNVDRDFLFGKNLKDNLPQP